jgi:hypothetical protein
MGALISRFTGLKGVQIAMITAGLKQATLQRITLIADESVEKVVVEQSLRLGAKSYICSFCSGKPLHNAVERPLTHSSLVRIELLAEPAETEAILTYIRNLQVRQYPVTAVMDSVEVFP